MNKPWLIRAAILIVVAALVAWIARNTYWEEVSIARPLKGAAATDSFYAIERFATSLGAHPLWQRDPAALPPPGAVVFISAWNWGVKTGRRARLEKWVESGGRLVLDSSVHGDRNELEQWTGLSHYIPALLARKGAKAPKPDLRPADFSAPLHQRAPNYAPRYLLPDLTLCPLDRLGVLRSNRKIDWALQTAEFGAQTLRVKVGRGSVTLINSIPFGNRNLTKCDNGKVFVAAAELRRGDDVWFITEEPGATLLPLIWRTGAPVVVLALILIGLWLWRAGVRFGPLAAVPEPARRSLAEQILGTGQFTVRFGGGTALHGAQVRALQETADRQIPGFARLDAAQRIAAIARLAHVNEVDLAEAMNASGSRPPAVLHRALTLLETARRVLSTMKNIGHENSREGLRHVL